MKRSPVYLLIAIPAVSVLMGMVSLYFAFTSSDREIVTLEQPLDKTSWRKSPSDD